MLTTAYTEETVPDADGKDSTRVVLRFHPALAPVKCAILPLLKNNDDLTGMARKVFDDLKFSFLCQYDEKDAIGRRYRRQDAIGTPFCVTIDHQSLEDQTVTIRERDTLKQDRVHISKIREIVVEGIDFEESFSIGISVNLIAFY
jgi:glycyl-tRNA synthetase